MTEDHAKQLWRPFARVHVPAGLINRISGALRRIAQKARAQGNIADAEYIEEQEADTRCIASGCMAWQWEFKSDPLRPEGFCGLARRP